MKHIAVIAVALVLPFTAHADVFKCKISETKTTYQPTPCANAAVAHKVEIQQRSPEQEAKAADQFKEWKTDYEAREIAEQKAKQDEFERKLRIREVEAQQANADAQYKQRDALNRQADELEKQNLRKHAPPPIMPGDYGYGVR